MICEECKDEGRTSRVYEGLSFTTAMWTSPYYDEDGKYHHHDINTTTTNYYCSNDHQFSRKHKPVWTCCEPKEIE